MSVDFDDAMEYPRRGEDVLRRFLIGGGIPSVLMLGIAFISLISIFLPFFGFLNVFLLPFGIAVGLFLAGYYLRVIRSTFAGSDVPPSFDDWQALVKDGAYAFVIGLVYSIPIIVMAGFGFVLFLLLVGGGAALGDSGGGAFAAVGILSILIFGVLMLLYFVYSLVMGYLLPISLCIYADTGDVKAAFSRERIVPMAKEKDYAIAWVAQFAVLFAVQSVIGGLTIILIGYLLYPLLPFVTFFVSTAAFYVFAQVYDDVIGASDVEISDEHVERSGEDESDAAPV